LVNDVVSGEYQSTISPIYKCTHQCMTLENTTVVSVIVKTAMVMNNTEYEILVISQGQL